MRLEEASGQPRLADNRPSGWDQTVGRLFDGFPYGLFTVDESRRVLSANNACREMLVGALDGPTSAPPTCCDLICGRRSHADDTSCLADEAVSVGSALPELRLDLTPSKRQQISAVWVTVSPLDDRGGAVFHLRPGEAGDRRRRTSGATLATPRLRVFTLGQTRVESSAAGPIGGDWLEQRPGQLLKYLVSTGGRVVEAEEIARSLWPDTDARALNSVRYFIHVLRLRLEPEREPRSRSSFVISRQGGYSLDDQHVWLDCVDFEQLVAAGLAAFVGGEKHSALRSLERAMGLYRGEFFADEPYAEWALTERDRLRELAGRALTALIELRLASGDPISASRHARRLADMEPYDSDAQRRHIELCMRRGRRGEAMRRYDLFRRRLARDLGEQPDFAIADLPSPIGDAGTSPPLT